MRRQLLTMALAIGAATAVAGAGILPDGFNITCQMGDGPIWNATSNPGDFSVKQTPSGATIWGESSTANWAATWESVIYTHNPSVTTAWSFTNNSGTAQTFTVTFTSPVAPMSGNLVMHGSITGGLTDNDGSGATLSAPSGGSVYTALVDGSAVSPTLFNDPFSVSTSPPNLVAPLGFESFQNEPGPSSVMTDIGIQHTFTLSAGDSVTFNTAFTIVPAPAGLAVFALLGAAGLGRRRR